MKKKTGLALIMILALGPILLSGCIIHDDDDYHSGSDGYYYPPNVPYDPYFNTLDVGNYCGCGDLCGCGFTDVDYSIDTMQLSGADWDLIDLQFAFTLTNWSAYEVPVYVMLCDDLGCEDVVYFNLLPYEVYSDSLPNPVLDTLMFEFDDCLNTWGDMCYMEYDIEVYLGEECVCSPVTLDYYYEGFYL